jgi:hypothetical protein
MVLQRLRERDNTSRDTDQSPFVRKKIGAETSLLPK